MPEPSQPKRAQDGGTGEATNKTPNPIIPTSGLTVVHTLQGHAGSVNSLAWSPDGSHLASSSDDYTIRIWDPASARLLSTLEGHTNEAWRLAWSPDSSRLASASHDHTIRLWDPASARLLSTLQAHTSWVWSLAWSPDGSCLASASSDKTIRLWDPASARLLSTLKGHMRSVLSLAWSPDGSRLASASSDKTIHLWDLASARLLSTLKGHNRRVQSVVWSPDGSCLASASSDKTIRLWDPASARLLSTLQAHTDPVLSLAWSSDGSRLASGSDDKTIRLWDPVSARLLSTLEGHTNGVLNLAWSPDGSLLTSSSALYSLEQRMYINGEVRTWRTDTWEPVAVLTGLNNQAMVAWHPRLALLATGGTRKEDILIWQLDLARLLKQAPVAETVHYKNAKVVLVGESGVGKSGLALVLTKKPFAPTESTHGRHVWLLDAQEVSLDGGSGGRKEQRETWLWDLAGQRDYRLIHQLHLHEATVALIVFDAGREGDPLAGIRYWRRALRLAQQARGSGALPLTTFLVAARMDRGGREVSRERIEALARELGCAGYIETSAKTGLGMEELRRAIVGALDWSNLPGVTSTVLLQDIKKGLLDEVQAGQLLRTVDELYQTFLRSSQVATPDAVLRSQFETVLGRLQAQGVLRWLSFGNLVLLQSERLDAYASALLIAVRNESDGLGIIAEERVRQGQFPIPQEDRISQTVQEQLLLLAMIEELVRQELILREGGFLLFPSQSTREHPEQAELSKQLNVIFSIAGPVLSIYTTLVVRLAHSGIFQKEEVWQRVVTYTTRLGGRFGLLLLPRGEEQAELGLFFDAAAREEMRFHFEDFIQRHLEHAMNDGSVPRRRQFICPQCGEVFSAEQVSKRRARGFETLRCTVCDTEVSLLDGVQRLDSQPVSQVKKMEQAADTQRNRQSAISVIEGKRATEDFDVFLCHHGQDKPAVKQIGQQLMAAGLLPWLDEWELRPGLPWQRALEEQIGKIKTAAVFVGKNGLGPWQQQELDAFLRAFVSRGCPVIPVLLADAPQEPALPVFLQAMTWVDFRRADPDPMQRLIWGITGKREGALP